VRRLKKYLVAAAILVLAIGVVAVYLVRGGFRRFDSTPYPLPTAAFTNWHDVLAHPRDISLTTFRTGVVHMDACLNLDPASPKQADCDHTPRDLAVLVHWVHHPRFGDFLIDAGFDDSFAKHPPYGNYTGAMKLFNWLNGVTNQQEPGEDLRAQTCAPGRSPEGGVFHASASRSHGGRSCIGTRDRICFRPW
jgi:N-acyl homoserine lactone hydrolase